MERLGREGVEKTKPVGCCRISTKTPAFAGRLEILIRGVTAALHEKLAAAATLEVPAPGWLEFS